MEDGLHAYYNTDTQSLELLSTVEPPNKGHFGNGPFVLCSEVVLISEVCHILTVNNLLVGQRFIEIY